MKLHNKFIYKCINCGKEYSDDIKYLCPVCEKINKTNLPPKGVLKTIYDYELILESVPDIPISVFNYLKSIKYLPLLPIKCLESLPNLRIGNTPLYKIKEFNNNKLTFNLYLKDDSQNPTFSFKDRASAIVSAYAKEKNYNTIITASTGNAGSSLAGICASQNQKAVIIVPETAPIAKLTQILMYGAAIIPVKGTYDDAFDLSIEASKEFGFYNRNTAYNPLTIEGKKTVSFEIYDKFRDNLPDRIFVPVGDGVIISGVYKGFEDLVNLGIIEEIPIIVAVQSEKSNNLVRNINKSEFKVTKNNTIADSIAVDIPRNFYMVQHYINKYNGEYISVFDDKIIEASGELAQNTGIFSEPAAATGFAGLLNYMINNKISDNSNNVVLLTGSGLKDLKSVQKIIDLPYSIEPDIKYLKELI